MDHPGTRSTNGPGELDCEKAQPIDAECCGDAQEPRRQRIRKLHNWRRDPTITERKSNRKANSQESQTDGATHGKIDWSSNGREVGMRIRTSYERGDGSGDLQETRAPNRMSSWTEDSNRKGLLQQI